jgi:hypothetical protein
MAESGDDLRGAFQDSLNSALARGLQPSHSIGLGDQTCSAIEAIAREHPDATAVHIADAYEAFDREHGAADAESMSERPAYIEPPKRLVARRKPFKRS